MRRILGLLVTAGIAFQANNSAAQSPWLKGCATPSAFADQLDVVDRSLGNLMLHVESVPPKEEEFLERELKARDELEDKMRFKAAFENRYYYAFQVHKAHRRVASDLKSARDNQKFVKKRTLELVSALSSYTELASSMSDYLSNTHTQGDRVEKMSFSLAGLRHSIARALKCNVQLMTEPSEGSYQRPG